mmetsp:Transcript_13687/g.46092  ORF Transcript_13687/g.46092 Transcript_13687/m.46092 type:complete len:104 (+) Transcript_13687:106-417(+)
MFAGPETDADSVRVNYLLPQPGLGSVCIVGSIQRHLDLAAPRTVGWVGSPFAVMAGWFTGTRLLGMDNRAQVMLLSVGAAWCGASGMAAVQPIVGATGDELTL